MLPSGAGGAREEGDRVHEAGHEALQLLVEEGLRVEAPRPGQGHDEAGPRWCRPSSARRRRGGVPRPGSCRRSSSHPLACGEGQAGLIPPTTAVVDSVRVGDVGAASAPGDVADHEPNGIRGPSRLTRPFGRTSDLPVGREPCPLSSLRASRSRTPGVSTCG